MSRPEVGLSDKLTLGGTMATGFITKLGRPAEIARADDGCSMGRQRCGDRLARAELG